MATVHMACDQLLEQTPFLMMDFRSGWFFLDGNQDGCVDATGTLASPEIDPADFLPAVDGAEEQLCNEDLLGHWQLNGLAAAIMRLYATFVGDSCSCRVKRIWLAPGLQTVRLH